MRGRRGGQAGGRSERGGDGRGGRDERDGGGGLGAGLGAEAEAGTGATPTPGASADELLNSGRIPDPQPEHTALFRALARALTATEARLRAAGGVSLRWGIRFLCVLVAAIGVFLLVGPVINAPMSFDEVIDSAAVDEVDWIARDVHVDYEVARDDAGMFVAQVRESFTADFRNGPESAVERTIVTEFEGHDVEFALHSAEVDGEAVEAEVERDATTTTLRLERPDGERFEGRQGITVVYELHHLIAPEVDDATGRVVDRLSWPLFAPTWPQATKGLEVTLTLAPDVDDALVRDPRAYVGWLLVSGTAWLEPEGETAEGVRYSFTNDDTLPPNADIWIHADFREGTFSQPPTTGLFWVQTYGPLLPLAVLAALLLFALAARRVVWADSAGDPWYLPRAEPPERMTPEFAAQLMGRPRHAELMDALEGAPQARDRARDRARRLRDRTRRSAGDAGRERWVAGAAQAGRRAGRLGNAPSRWRWTLRWRLGRAVEERGLRWAPDSYVRDVFLLAPVAIALLQWGLLRQLSHQVILLVVWWPFAFVVVSTLLAVATVAAVRRPRPLTPEGARAVQQLKGIDAYARTTRLVERGPLDEPLLPYALLFERPRRAGRAVVEHAVREAGDESPVRGWRTDHFVSGPALLALAAAVAVFAGSIVLVSTQPPPYDVSDDRITRHDELPGTFYTEVQGFEIEAELSRADDGRARLSVTEKNTVRFDGSASRVPQFAREWPSTRFGQDLGLEVESFRIDGEPAPIREVPQRGSLAVVTQLEEVLDGSHEVEIEYTLANAAVDARSGGSAVDQVRWTAWYSFWEDEYYTDAGEYFDGRSPVRPIRIQFTVAPDLVDEIEAGGWIDSDHDLRKEPGEHGNWMGPWVVEGSAYDYRSRGYELRIGSETERDDGALVVVLDADEVESRPTSSSGLEDETRPFAVDPEVNAWLGKHELQLQTDLGVRLDFAPGTFAEVTPGAYERHLGEYRLPFTLTVGLAGAVIAASAGMIVFLRRSGRRPSLSLAAIGLGAIPIAGVAQCVLFFWVVPTMSGSDGRGGVAIAAGAVMLTAVITEAVMLLRRRARDRPESKPSLPSRR